MTEEPNDWVLRKRGYFYRPGSMGYTSSIHEAGRYTEAEAKAHAAQGIEPAVTAHRASDFIGAAVTEEVVSYVSRYGGRCRNCADENGICQSSGLPCEDAARTKAIRHVLSAYNYGTSRGYINR